MTKTQETQIALHEQRITAIEVYHKTVDKKLDIILEKMDNQFVTQRNYEQDLKRFLKTDIEIETRLAEIEKNMVTQDEFEKFQDNIRRELKRKGFANWVNPIIAALSTSIVTFLIIYFFNNINR